MNINTKKAAMFGLDARIALAIFGALSVITGASLYSAIQGAKVTKTLTELAEIGKAYDAYYLDVGEELDIAFFDIYLNITSLESSVKRGWKGPYINLEISGPFQLESLDYNDYFIQELKDGAWAGTTEAAWSDANCVTGSITGTCSVWVAVNSLTGKEAIVTALDMAVDGSNTPSTGNLRWAVLDDGTTNVYLKSRPSNRY